MQEKPAGGVFMDRKEEYRKLLTIPDEIRDYRKLTLSGNEYISIPEIDQARY